MNLPLYSPDPATATRYLSSPGKGSGQDIAFLRHSVEVGRIWKARLLVSTDPASNLHEVLETTLTNQATAVHDAAGLHALNINPVAAAYRDRLIGPMRGILPEAALRSMEEQGRLFPFISTEPLRASRAAASS